MASPVEKQNRTWGNEAGSYQYSKAAEQDKEVFIREVLRKMKTDLAKDIDLGSVVPLLYRDRSISDEHQDEILAYERSRGSIYAAHELLQLVIDNKVQASRFVAVFGEADQPWIQEQINDGVKKFQTGEWSLDMTKIKALLRQRYLDPEFTDLQVIPGVDEGAIPLSEQMLKADFDAKVIKTGGQLAEGSVRQKRQVSDRDYRQVNAGKLQEVVDEISGKPDNSFLNLQPKLLEMLGVAGTGKTAGVKQLAWLWSNDKSEILAKFDFVFFLPVKAALKNDLLDILCDLNLLLESDKEVFSMFLQNPTNAKTVLFILDGADENDIPIGKDIFNLVTGRLVPESTVLITARPEAKCLSSFDKKPRVKVTLHGTDPATRDTMLNNAVEGASDEEKAQFESKIIEKLTDTNLLLIPLYLTLLCALFQTGIAEGTNIANLAIPGSMTQLFNSIMQVILQRWLLRTNRKHVKVTFTNSPLGSGSTVPSDIKRALYFIGRLCYRGLLVNKVEFSEQDAAENYLDMEDIKKSGLFTVCRSGTGEMFFTRHRQLQEYLSSLYLDSEGPEQSSFQHILQSEKNTGKPLGLVMRDCKLVKVIQFVCGLSGKFMKSLFEGAASRFPLMKNKYGQIDMYFEAALFTEQHVDALSTTDGNSLTGYNELTHYLCTSKKQEFSKREGFNFLLSSTPDTVNVLFHQKCLSYLTSLFSQDLAVKLFNRLYDIHLTEVPASPPLRTLCYTVDSASCLGSELCLCLDQLQAELLAKVRIHGVQSLGVDTPTPVYVDLPGLVGTFPHLTWVYVMGGTYTAYSSGVSEEPTARLTSVTLRSMSTHTSLPESHMQCLLHQSVLTHLDLDHVSTLSVLGRSPHLLRSWRCQLEHLTLQENFTRLHDSAALGLCALLQASCHTLRECDLRVWDIPIHLIGEMEQGLQSLKQLKSLELSVASSDRSDCVAQVLVNSLSGLTTLTSLSVMEMSVDPSLVDPLSIALKSLKQLERLTLEVKASDEWDCTPQVLVNSLSGLVKLTSLNLHGVSVDSSVVDPLSNALKSLEQLKSLTVGVTSNYGPDGTARVLVNSLNELTTLTSLSVCDMSVDSSLVDPLAHALKSLKQLESLKVTSSDRSDCTARVMANSLSGLNTLRSLSLGSVLVDPSLVDPLSHALRSLTQLESLQLSVASRDKSDCAARVLINSLSGLPHLSILKVKFDSIKCSYEEFTEAVCHCDSLRTLTIDEFGWCGSKLPDHLSARITQRGVQIEYSYG